MKNFVLIDILSTFNLIKVWLTEVREHKGLHEDSINILFIYLFIQYFHKNLNFYIRKSYRGARFGHCLYFAQ